MTKTRDALQDTAGAEVIPVIDLAPWHGGGPEAQAAIVDQVRRACEEIGFFVVAGHGVPEALVTRMAELSRGFFDLPAADKTQVARSGSEPGGLTYVPVLAERLAATRGEVTPGDLKESLDYGPGFPGDHWPSAPSGLAAVWRDYYQAMDQLCGHLRRIFARAIGLEEDFFEDKFLDHLSSLRVLNYPAPTGPLEPGQLRAGAHRDYGFLTILRSEDRPGGLQVKDRAGRWVAPPALPGTFVVNLGDALMRWTNDHWVSTLHRVVGPPREAWRDSRRQSIAFFHNPARAAVIDCLAAFRQPGVAPIYEPIRYGAYAELRYRQAHNRTLILQ